MTTDSTHAPTTIPGIKSLAKRLKRVGGIQHARALDLAAQQAGYNNYTHAQRSLAAAPARAAGPRAVDHDLYLTCYWRDRRGNGEGRETLKVSLRRPWSEMLAPQALRHVPRLFRFHAQADDHLQHAQVMPSQDAARGAVNTAARTLVFMETTGLRPAPSRRVRDAYPDRDVAKKIPGEDHATRWVLSSTGEILIADEPYVPSGRTDKASRDAWAAQHGYAVVVPSWRGMYNPNATQLHLIAKRESEPLLRRLEQQLGTLPPAIGADTWLGESAPYRPVFVSPGPQRVKQARPPRDPSRRLRRAPAANTVGFIRTFVGPQRRPDGLMPVAAHKEAARLLIEVHARCYFRPGARNRIDQVRSELDEWVMREYDRNSLPNEVFQNLYYAGGYGVSLKRAIAVVEARTLVGKLERVGELLKTHYPESAPRHRLLHMLAMASASILDWSAVSERRRA